MEILYLTDIHDNLKRLRYVIRNTEADLYIISGDLIYKAFFTETKLYEFVTLQEEFYYYLSKKKIRRYQENQRHSIRVSKINFEDASQLFVRIPLKGQKVSSTLSTSRFEHER